MVPSREEEIELARRIEESEREVLRLLLRSAVMPKELTAIARKLDEEALSPWDIVIGTMPQDAGAKRQVYDELRRSLREISKLDARCQERRRELFSHRRPSEKRATQLQQELETLWQRMALGFADTRLAGEHVTRMSEQTRGARCDRRGTPSREGQPR